MNSKRTPFQFTSIDPAKRQAELRKRFGLPSSDMILDFMNPSTMGARSRDSFFTSEKLQPKAPTSNQGADVQAELMRNVDGHKPKVRVIPIKVEGVDESTRHRSFSGPAGTTNETEMNSVQMPKTFLNGPSKGSVNAEAAHKPRVCNIPVQIEPKDNVKHVKTGKPQKSKSFFQTNDCNLETVEKVAVEKTNGCAASCEQSPEPQKSIPLKLIENVLNKLKTYHEEVEKFTGTAKDKQYRYLDEMLTRCMLDLDNVDTLGLNEVRQSRKAAVKKVQASLDLLEEKINMTELNVKEAETISACANVVGDVQMEEVIDESKNKQASVEDIEMKEDVAEIPSSSPVGLNASVKLNEVIDAAHPIANIESEEQNIELGQLEVEETVIQDNVLNEEMQSKSETAVPVENSDQIIVCETPTNSVCRDEENCSTAIDIVQNAPMEYELTNQTVPVKNSDTNELSNEIEIQEIKSLSSDELATQPIVIEPCDSDESLSDTTVDTGTCVNLPVINESANEDIEISELEN